MRAWDASFETLFGSVAECFRTEEALYQARAYLMGLVSDVTRKNGWTLAERAGDPAPHKMQRLLNEYAWDADAVRDVVRSYVIESLWEEDGVLVADESGFPKKGFDSAGVQRQYSGTAGRVENCQIGVFTAYVSGKGRALHDCRLYMPAGWIDDPSRCHTAGVPEDLAFATKPALALDMIRAAVQAGGRFRWVAGDEVYGADAALSSWLEDHDLGYVLAVACNRMVATAGGKIRVDTLADMVAEDSWEVYAAADGSKGPRLYDWALIDTTDLSETAGRPRQVLVRRGRDRKQELAFFIVYSPRPVPPATFITVAGRRWGIEECFQSGKNEVGLDHYQVRLYRAWYRHMTLAILAHAWLAITASREKQSGPPDERKTTAVGYQPDADGSLPIPDPAPISKHAGIPLTLNEIRRLHAHCHPVRHLHEFILKWSNWRRRHQAHARYYHYRRRIRAAQSPSRQNETAMLPLLL